MARASEPHERKPTCIYKSVKSLKLIDARASIKLFRISGNEASLMMKFPPLSFPAIRLPAKVVETAVTRTITSTDERKFVFPGLTNGLYENRSNLAIKA